ncbi:hypothetical protein ACFOY8_12095 [Thalassospira xianhensis]|uniref:Uncharacterized protein n=1 Tax=Thalassospira xianhensis MCCC 1A02616 TaxID=1177929 RepID=A0A367UEF7_9PROT|nr:hypothetical protein [Thalassospira xianhensis]RCK06391.1 hypothetical protein TH5_09370 [Thalassospira xianhensis MCCC 1A02616]
MPSQNFHHKLGLLLLSYLQLARQQLHSLDQQNLATLTRTRKDIETLKENISVLEERGPHTLNFIFKNVAKSLPSLRERLLSLKARERGCLEKSRQVVTSINKMFEADLILEDFIFRAAQLTFKSERNYALGSLETLVSHRSEELTSTDADPLEAIDNCHAMIQAAAHLLDAEEIRQRKRLEATGNIIRFRDATLHKHF